MLQLPPPPQKWQQNPVIFRWEVYEKQLCNLSSKFPTISDSRNGNHRLSPTDRKNEENKRIPIYIDFSVRYKDSFVLLEHLLIYDKSTTAKSKFFLIEISLLYIQLV
uniref:Uncharacterized protein n=2 Tax=Micrurus TaxID=8634 RepID=A0A2D4KKZ6_9SAUR